MTDGYLAGAGAATAAPGGVNEDPGGYSEAAFLQIVDNVRGRVPGLSPLAAAILAALHLEICRDSRTFARLLWRFACAGAARNYRPVGRPRSAAHDRQPRRPHPTHATRLGGRRCPDLRVIRQSGAVLPTEVTGNSANIRKFGLASSLARTDRFDDCRRD